MRHLFFLTVVLVIIVIYFQYDNVSEKPIESTKTNNDSSEIENPTKENVKNKTLIESFFETISFDQKKVYFGLCLGYSMKKDGGSQDFYVLSTEEAVSNFIESHQGTEFNDIQLRAITNVFKRCEDFVGFEDDLHDEVVNNPFTDEKGIGLIEKELRNTVAINGKDAAFKLMEDNLLSHIFQHRSNAKAFARKNPEWLKDINDSLDFDLLDKESFDYFQKALTLLECDLQLLDCSANSLAMLDYCNIIPEACGVDARDFYRSTISSFEMFYVDKYMIYLLSLRRNQMN